MRRRRRLGGGPRDGAGGERRGRRSSAARPPGIPRFLGEFGFFPKGDKVHLWDASPNNWGVLVELWWGGKLRRWCWNAKGGLTNQVCDFEIPEGRNIRFFIAEFKRDQWRRCAPIRGCGKRTHHWAGPDGNDGCRANRWRPPCGFTHRTVSGENDFRGEA